MFLLCDIEGRRSQFATSEQTLGYTVGWDLTSAPQSYMRGQFGSSGIGMHYWYAASVFAMSASVFPSSAWLNSPIDPRPRL
jgi:hypothetical protein